MNTPEPNEMPAQPAVMTAVVTIKRANTGKEETYNLTFGPLPGPEQTKEPE